MCKTGVRMCGDPNLSLVISDTYLFEQPFLADPSSGWIAPREKMLLIFPVIVMHNQGAAGCTDKNALLCMKNVTRELRTVVFFDYHWLNISVLWWLLPVRNTLLVLAMIKGGKILAWINRDDKISIFSSQISWVLYKSRLLQVNLSSYFHGPICAFLVAKIWKCLLTCWFFVSLWITMEVSHWRNNQA